MAPDDRRPGEPCDGPEAHDGGSPHASRIPWWLFGSVGLLLAAMGLACWSTQLGRGLPRLSALKVGTLAASATTAALLGLLLAVRVRDAALAAIVFADAGALVALLVGAGRAGVRLDLALPLGALLAVLVGAALGAGARGRRRPWVGLIVQGGYLAALLVLGWRLAPGRLPGLAWLGVVLSVGLAILAHLAWVHTAPAALWSRLGRLGTKGQALLVLVASFAGFAAAAGPRLQGPTSNNHFVFLADSYLHGRLSLGPKQLERKNRLKQYDDWARVDRVRLRQEAKSEGMTLSVGTELRGAWIEQNRRRNELFRTTRGRLVRLPPGSWQPAGSDWYVSFPPFPAVLMMPGVAVMGYRLNDVWFTVILASLSPLLLFLLLGRLRKEGLSERGVGDDLWLTLLFAFGTVNYFVSVRGEVWYTAHVVGVLCLLGFLHASLGARRPELAGLALGCAMGSRVGLLLAFPIFLAEVWRTRVASSPQVANRGRIDGEVPAPARGFFASLGAVPWRDWAVPVLRFGVPVMLVGALLLWHNAARFDSPFEFGHRYLDIYWKERIQQWGLFDVHYLPRNLTAAFTLLPHLQPEPPYLLISRHGLSLLFVTPALLFLLWPKHRGPWHRPLWTSVAGMGTLVFFYQNTGFVQFAYRFSLDFTPLLVLLLALGGRRLSTAMKVLILWGVLVNLFGAVTFGIAPELYGRTNWVWTPLDPACAC